MLRRIFNIRNKSRNNISKFSTFLSGTDENNMPTSKENNYNIKVHNEILTMNKKDDLNRLINSFTAPALATALRDRELTLATLAYLYQKKRLNEVEEILKPFFEGSHYQIRTSKVYSLSQDQDELIQSDDNNKDALIDNQKNSDNLTPISWTDNLLLDIQKRLRRIPRFLTKETELRASVVIPLCHNNGVPSILFTKRSEKVRRHKGQMCFPGGMVDDKDLSIHDTALRELEEELGIPIDKVRVLGVLRCDWSEVASLTGISVTPIIGYIGEIADYQMKPNADEVNDIFTVPIGVILNNKNWELRDYSAPVFSAPEFSPTPVWGLTGYILERFMTTIVKPALANNGPLL